MAAPQEDLLYGQWFHSHEEDTNSEMVFRPAPYSFPPSRGRMSFELRPDRTYVESSPGPADVPEKTTGDWALEGNRLVLGAEGDRPGHAWEIAGVEADRLVVKK